MRKGSIGKRREGRGGGGKAKPERGLSSQKVGKKPVLGHLVVADLRQVQHERLETGSAVVEQSKHGIYHMLSLLQVYVERREEEERTGAKGEERLVAESR